MVAGVVNLEYQRGAIGNVESYAQAVYGYDVRTEVVGSIGIILIGSLQQHSGGFSYRQGRGAGLGDHFLSGLLMLTWPRCGILFTTCCTISPRVTGEDGVKALAITVAAEESYLQAKPVEVALAGAKAAM